VLDGQGALPIVAKQYPSVDLIGHPPWWVPGVLDDFGNTGEFGGDLGGGVRRPTTATEAPRK